MTIWRKLHKTQHVQTKKHRYFCSMCNGMVLLTLAIGLLITPERVHAQQRNYAYVALEPDIVTNYAGDNSKKLGYVRVTIEMMVADPAKIVDVEHHMPLLRATAIEVLGAQPEDKIRSLTGREDIRRMVLQKFKDIMKRETGENVIENIIFTKYLRQGG